MTKGIIAGIIALCFVGSASSLVQEPKPTGAKGVSEIFKYYDTFVERFKKKELDSFTSMWAKEYDDYFGEAFLDKSARERFSAQIAFTGKFQQGPYDVFVESIKPRGEGFVVTGFWHGNFKLEDGYKPGTLSEGAASFSHPFTHLWVKDGGVYLLKNSRKGEYEELSEAAEAAWKKKHAKAKELYVKASK